MLQVYLGACFEAFSIIFHVFHIASYHTAPGYSMFVKYIIPFCFTVLRSFTNSHHYLPHHSAPVLGSVDPYDLLVVPGEVPLSC